MKPALLRVLPAAALSVPLLVGVATTAAANPAPGGGVFAEEGHDSAPGAGHDPAPAVPAPAEPTPAGGATGQDGSVGSDEMTDHDDEMADHEKEMADHEEEMTEHEEDMVDHDDETGGHGKDVGGHDDGEAAAHDDEETSGHDDEETSGHDDEETSGHDEGSVDDHGATVAEGDRPRAAVLSSFAGVNAAVLGGAAFLRRRDRLAVRHRTRREADPAVTPPASGSSAVTPTAPASVDAEI